MNKRIINRYKRYKVRSTIHRKKYNKVARLSFVKNNKCILVFHWLFYKLFFWYYYIFLKSIFLFALFNIVPARSLIDANNLFFCFKDNASIDSRYLIINNYIVLLESKKINSVIPFIFNFMKNKFNHTKLKKITFFFNFIYNSMYINKIDLKNHYLFNGFLNQKKKLNNLGILKSFYNYTRIKSYYRLQKKKKREKKKKQYFLKHSLKIFTFNYRLFCSNTKWLKKYYSFLSNKQLVLKINDTLNCYLKKSIFFFHQSNKFTFNRFDNPKLLSEYIKFFNEI